VFPELSIVFIITADEQCVFCCCSPFATSCVVQLKKVCKKMVALVTWIYLLH